MKNSDIGYLIKITSDKLKTNGDASLKKMNLTFAQSRMLSFLNNNNGQATQKELEIFLDVSHPTVVGIVSRMEQNGYVVSWMDDKNKRNKNIKLTDKAREVAKEFEEDIAASEKIMLESLSDEDIECLKHSLTVIYNNLAKRPIKL